MIRLIIYLLFDEAFAHVLVCHALLHRSQNTIERIASEAKWELTGATISPTMSRTEGIGAEGIGFVGVGMHFQWAFASDAWNELKGLDLGWLSVHTDL